MIMKSSRTAIFMVAAVVIVITAAVLLQVMPSSATSANDTTSAPRTVTAQGHGEIAVNPEQAFITLGVQSRAKEAKTALANNNEKMNAVVATVARQGIPKQLVQTTDFSLWYDSQQNIYVANHNLALRVDNLQKLGVVLDACVAAGANNSWGVSFGVKNPTTARAQALKAAVADARKRADSIAAAMGAKITQSTSVLESSGSVGGMGAGKRAGGGGTSFQPGQTVVSADVTVTFSTR
jgi:uncharacterized protein YggE